MPSARSHRYGIHAEVAARRKRDYLREPAQGLAALGIEAASIRDVILTHFHYDHVGGYRAFPDAQFHVQDAEMRYATGRFMCHSRFSHGYDVEDVEGMIRLVFSGRVTFHKGDAELYPGSACISSGAIRGACSAFA
jgi:glyoxylase-like metal-dependent hydrolase (beta-lactamase superfamily II)